MIFIGDCHSQYKTYHYILNKMLFKRGRKGADCSIQLGDMGVGFIGWNENIFKNIGTEHKFIRGNHDNPGECENVPNYMGDFGFIEKQNLFYVSGGLSLDKKYRILGFSWWNNEEFSYKQAIDCIELYQKSRPRIMISHECPTEIKYLSLMDRYNNDIISNTEKLLQNLLEIHRPDIWIFGHHHRRIKRQYKNTTFVGLDQINPRKLKSCIYEIEDLKW